MTVSDLATRLGITKQGAAQIIDDVTGKTLAQASDAVRAEHALIDGRRQQWRQLALELRRQLQVVYESKASGAAPGAAPLQAARQAVHQDFLRRYQALKTDWGGYAGYDRWVAELNNARLGALAEYEDLTPAFEQLWRRAGSWPRFYEDVRRLARLPQAERRAVVADLLMQLVGFGAIAAILPLATQGLRLIKRRRSERQLCESGL